MGAHGAHGATSTWSTWNKMEKLGRNGTKIIHCRTDDPRQGGKGRRRETKKRGKRKKERQERKRDEAGMAMERMEMGGGQRGQRDGGRARRSPCLVSLLHVDDDPFLTMFRLLPFSVFERLLQIV